MELSENRILTILKENKLILLLSSIGLICLSIGLIQFVLPKNSDVVFEKGAESKGVVEAASTNSVIMVDIEGSVIKPGVYKLAPDSRIQDALVAAGGLSIDANREYVSKKLNQAQKLTDGMKLYIPSQTDHNASQDIISSGSEANASGQININSASASELDSLPGIGAVTAGKIIAGRSYTSIEELTSKKIVSPSVFEKIKDKISVY